MYKHHKVLKILLKHFNDSSHTTLSLDDKAKALNLNELQRRTNYKTDTLSLILSSLYSQDFVDKTKIHGKGDTIFWSITDKGKNALTNNTFRWFYKTDNILKIITLIIAIIGLLNSIFHFIDTQKQ
ncbi:MAG: hypothetical protein IE891_08255 [Flavobacteriaceae bacterium]|nr:hypothetical protein [Flavobacteriaceae bacterium]